MLIFTFKSGILPDFFKKSSFCVAITNFLGKFATLVYETNVKAFTYALIFLFMQSACL